MLARIPGSREFCRRKNKAGQNPTLVMLLHCCYTVAMERNEQIVSTNTRYPKDLHDALQKLAREHKRSFNAEVMWALQTYVKQEEAVREDANGVEVRWSGKASN